MSAVIDRFEARFEDLVVSTGYYGTATSNSTAVAMPQEDVDKFMSQVADEAALSCCRRWLVRLQLGRLPLRRKRSERTIRASGCARCEADEITDCGDPYGGVGGVSHAT